VLKSMPQSDYAYKNLLPASFDPLKLGHWCRSAVASQAIPALRIHMVNWDGLIGSTAMRCKWLEYLW